MCFCFLLDTWSQLCPQIKGTTVIISNTFLRIKSHGAKEGLLFFFFWRVCFIAAVKAGRCLLLLRSHGSLPPYRTAPSYLPRKANMFHCLLSCIQILITNVAKTYCRPVVSVSRQTNEKHKGLYVLQQKAYRCWCLELSLIYEKM